MKYSIIILFWVINPFNKHTLNNEFVECEILKLHSYTIDTLSFDTIQINYQAKSNYCNLILNFTKDKQECINFKRIKIGGIYNLLLKFLPNPSRINQDEYNPNILHYFVSNLIHGELGLYYNKDSLYELEFYYKNNFQKDSMAFNYLPLNVKGNFIHDSLIIYQP